MENITQSNTNPENEKLEKFIQDIFSAVRSPSPKIMLIKAVRSFTGHNLKEAKDIIDNIFLACNIPFSPPSDNLIAQKDGEIKCLNTQYKALEFLFQEYKEKYTQAYNETIAGRQYVAKQQSIIDDYEKVMAHILNRKIDSI